VNPTLVADSPASRFALPIFMTRENKWPACILMFSLATVLYLSSNHIHIFEPRYLPMTWLDHATPFLPNSVWLYLSEYFLFAAVVILCKDLANLNKYLYSFFALQTVCVAIFWIWPTTYPRGNFPLPDDLNSLTYFVFDSLRKTDTPANCCPSLHVSSVYLSSFVFLDEQKKKFPFFFIWGTLIAASTMTTKQHYIIDVIVGFIMAVLMYWLFHKVVPYRVVGAQAKR
jgi:membrane-associated phospholipid phosphatase